MIISIVKLCTIVNLAHNIPIQSHLYMNADTQTQKYIHTHTYMCTDAISFEVNLHTDVNYNHLTLNLDKYTW